MTEGESSRGELDEIFAEIDVEPVTHNDRCLSGCTHFKRTRKRTTGSGRWRSGGNQGVCLAAGRQTVFSESSLCLAPDKREIN